MVASGGIVKDYTVSGDTYRAHIFTTSGTFTVTTQPTVPTVPSSIDYLVVGGGGGGSGMHSSNGTAGAGAGGLRTNMPTCPYAQAPYPVAPGPYTVVVGGGGGYARENPGIPSAQQYASQGSNSELYPTPGGSGSGIVATGGGAGQAREFSPGPVHLVVQVVVEILILLLILSILELQ